MARQQVSYALGRNFAANLRANEIVCDLDFLFAGISDVLKNAPPKWTDEQLKPVLQQFGQEMEQKAVARFERQAQANEQAAAKFLAENAKREGVQTTPSGLQYRVLRPGNGASPTLNDRVRCHYRGTLLDGTEFDSSAGGPPAEFCSQRGHCRLDRSSAKNAGRRQMAAIRAGQFGLSHEPTTRFRYRAE